MTLMPEEHPSKAAFLQRVREALGRGGPVAHMPDHPSLKTNAARQEEKVRTILAKNAARRSQTLDRLARTAAAASWNVRRAHDAEDAAGIVAEIAQQAGAKRLVRSVEDVFKRVNVDAALRSAGATATALSSGRSRSKESLREMAFGADMGITGVSYAIAETASCVITPRRGVARLTSLAPPALVLLVEPEQALETLDDFFAITRLSRMQARGRTVNYFNFISGPSRTADIEQTLTVGVHGPGDVHMVIIG